MMKRKSKPVIRVRIYSDDIRDLVNRHDKFMYEYNQNNALVRANVDELCETFNISGQQVIRVVNSVRSLWFNVYFNEQHPVESVGYSFFNKEFVTVAYNYDKDGTGHLRNQHNDVDLNAVFVMMCKLSFAYDNYLNKSVNLLSFSNSFWARCNDGFVKI